MTELVKPIVFISGVNSGIGYYLTQKLRDQYKIIGTVRNPEDKLRLISEFPDLDIILLDLADRDSINSAISTYLNKNPNTKIYGIINNAGYALPGPLLDLDMDEFEHQMKVNVINQLCVVQNLSSCLIEGKSRIINISSISGLFASPFLGAYCTSKFAFEGMSDSLRRELSLIGIKLILIEPGPILTSIWNKNLGIAHKFQNSRFSSYLKDADEIIKNRIHSALPLSTLLNPVRQALENKNPKNRYLIHAKPLLAKFISHFIPSKIADYLVNKKLRSKNKNFRPV